MKKGKLGLFSMFVYLFLLSCSSEESKIEGTYVNYLQGEYSIAWDTLIIVKSSHSEGSFTIESHTGFQRILNGKLQDKKFKNKSWVAEWDEEAQAFAPSPYYPDIKIIKNGLLLKRTAYRKIK